MKKTLKARIAPIIPAVIGLVPTILALFKKKPWVLWYHEKNGAWTLKSGAMSARNCRKMRDALVSTGDYEPVRFLILRQGVKP